MSKALVNTDFHFNGQKNVYNGKVRDVYNNNDEKLVMVATDRISAFDVVLPKGIPYKGQILNQIAAKFLDLTTDKTLKLNGDIKFNVKDGTIGQVGYVEYILKVACLLRLWQKEANRLYYLGQ